MILIESKPRSATELQPLPSANDLISATKRAA